MEARAVATLDQGPRILGSDPGVDAPQLVVLHPLELPGGQGDDQGHDHQARQQASRSPGQVKHAGGDGDDGQGRAQVRLEEDQADRQGNEGGGHQVGPQGAQAVLGQQSGQDDDQTELGEFRWLQIQEPQVDPAPGLVALLADQGN